MLSVSLSRIDGTGRIGSGLELDQHRPPTEDGMYAGFRKSRCNLRGYTLGPAEGFEEVMGHDDLHPP